MGMQVSGINDLSLGGKSSWLTPGAACDARRSRAFLQGVKVLPLLVDAWAAFAAWSAVLVGRRLSQSTGAEVQWPDLHDALLVVLAIGIQGLSYRASGLYDGLRQGRLAGDVISIAWAQALSTLILMVIAYVSNGLVISIQAIVAMSLLNLGMCITWRIAHRRFAVHRFQQGYGGCNLLIWGAGAAGCALARKLMTDETGCRFIGFLDSDSDLPDVLGEPRDFTRIARLHFIDTLIIVAPQDRLMVERIADEARRLNVSVKIIPDELDALIWQSPVEMFGDTPVRTVYRPAIQHPSVSLKRAMDVVAATAALLMLLPVLCAIALIVRCDSPGPVLYRSERVGRKGRRFVFYKFRTMIPNADAVKEKIRHLNEREGILFKIRQDPRVTRAGRFLRKYSLDELPQLWNVLKGDMSLIGPRPPLPSEVEMYGLEHLRRLSVTPGITGLWQITAREDPSFTRYFDLDIQYIENWSPLLDLKVLCKTIPAVLKGTGR